MKSAYSIFKASQRLMHFNLHARRAFCSNQTGLVELNPEPKIKSTEESHSWSYELSEDHIKGIKFSPIVGSYVITYTCGVCEKRQGRSFSKNSYHNGVVIVRCEGCDNLHLIADNLKWFEDKPTNIEDYMKIQNKEVQKIIAEGPLKEKMIEMMQKTKIAN